MVVRKYILNPYLTNGFSYYCHLGESTFIFRGIKSDFKFSSNFLMKILLANRIAPDGAPRSAASHLGLFCLHMSNKRDARLLNELTCVNYAFNQNPPVLFTPFLTIAYFDIHLLIPILIVS